MDHNLMTAKLYPLVKTVWSDDPYLENEPDVFKKAIDRCKCSVYNIQSNG
jgi:hypothetical protein